MKIRGIARAAAVAGMAACSRGGEVERAPVAAPAAGAPAAVQLRPCPGAAVGREEWKRVQARYGGFALRLPPDSRRVLVRRERDSPGERWAVDERLEVTYGVYADPVNPRPLTEADLSVVTCGERIGGSVAEVRMFYATAAYEPGQYVSARWSLGDGRMLVVQAVSRDSLRRDEMLSIVRSVEFDR